MLFKAILQKEGWHENVEIKTDGDGLITAIESVSDGGTDLALPGFRNTHSHAFQYAMAGIAENHSDPADDFWSWRSAMYKLALEVSPDQLKSIAKLLYSEMLRNGYTHVAEFHYLHHDKDGRPYDNPAETASSLIAAAEETGINITIVPVYYKTGGFGMPASESQRRFIFEDVDQYLKLVEGTVDACKGYEYANCGFGVHSLRSASAEDIKSVFQNGPKDTPFHIHIAEQLKEVEDCVAFYGKRPVEWLLDNIDVDERCNLVHATYLIESEMTGIALSGANVVLCPTTEGNLGDGIFSLKHFKNLKGRWSIGSDSNICLDPFEEIRLLDYGQRLTSRSRNTFGKAGARYAIEAAFEAGQHGVGEPESDYFEVGKPLNACVIGSEHPLISEVSPSNRLNAILYATGKTSQKSTIVNGKRSPESGAFYNEFRIAVRELANR